MKASQLPTEAATEHRISSDSDASVIVNDLGNTIIRHDVVARIVGATARDVAGVYRLAPFGASQSMASLARQMTGGETQHVGVQVEIENGECSINLRVVARYGTSLPEMAEEIRHEVADRVATLAGLKVDAVNIDVVDLHFPDDEESSDDSPLYVGS